MSEASTRTIGSTLAAKASAKKTPGTGANADVPVKGKMSREEFMREKALDEARKAGSIPAELDEEGNEINPVGGCE